MRIRNVQTEITQKVNKIHAPVWAYVCGCLCVHACAYVFLCACMCLSVFMHVRALLTTFAELPIYTDNDLQFFINHCLFGIMGIPAQNKC